LNTRYGSIEYGEVLMRRIERRVARRADMADHVALGDVLAVVQAVRVALEVCVVVGSQSGMQRQSVTNAKVSSRIRIRESWHVPGPLP